MSPRTCTLHLAIAAVFALASPGIGAQMYKWADEAGNVTYSNTPPADPAKVKDVTKIDDINTVPIDKRPKEPQAASTSEPSVAKPDTPDAKPESVTVRPAPPPTKADATRPEAAQVSPAPVSVRSEMTPRADPPLAKSDTEPPRAGESPRREPEVVRFEPAPRAPNRAQPEAVQDPCLRSADPQCYQRNRDKYHPYMGYAPSATRAPVTGAVGASISPAGGGAVGGQVGAVPATEKRAAPSVPTAPAINVKTK